MRVLVPIDGGADCREAIRFINSRKSWLSAFDDMAEDIETLPGQVTKISKIGHPAKVIADRAREIGADLIIMGARGLGAVKNLYLGSVSLGTLAKASCPVLICREHYTPKDEGLKIGIAVDGSGFGERCAKFVAQQKELFGSNAQFEVIFVHADEETIPRLKCSIKAFWKSTNYCRNLNTKNT